MPQAGTLLLNTVNGGEIAVANLKGAVELNTINSNIRLADIFGTAIANTVYGNVKATFTSVTSDNP